MPVKDKENWIAGITYRTAKQTRAHHCPGTGGGWSRGKSSNRGACCASPWALWTHVSRGAQAAEPFTCQALSLSASLCGMKTNSRSLPLLGSLRVSLRSLISEEVSFSTSLILIPPLAISSRIKRFLGFDVLKIISSMVSFSIMFQWYDGLALKSFFNIGVSHGFRNSWSMLFLIKLKKDNRWE